MLQNCLTLCPFLPNDYLQPYLTLSSPLSPDFHSQTATGGPFQGKRYTESLRRGSNLLKING